MRLKLFGRRLVNPVQKDLSPYTGQADNVFGFLSQKYGVDFRSRNRLNAYKGVVYGCVSLIGSAMTDYRPYLEQKKGMVWERVDHEFMDLLYQPGGREAGDRSDSFSSTDLWEATGIYQVLQGDAYWAFNMGKTTGKPREIVILRADKVGQNIDPNTGKVTGYFIRQATGDPIPLDTREVLRFPLFNPSDPYNGKSVVAAANDYIITDEATSEFTNAFFKNGGAISGVLSLNGDMTGPAFKKFVRAFREKYQGVTNAGKVAILRKSDASYEKIGLGLDELDMQSLRKMSLADVAMMFGVPLELLGKVTDGAGLGRANIEALEYNFAKWNIDKKMKRFDSIIAFALLRYYDLDSSEYRVRHENIIPEDKEYELNRLDKLVDRTITRNEARAKEEAPDAPGGDQLFVPAMQLPLDDPSSAAPTAAASYAPIKVKLVRSDEKKKDLTRASKPSAAAAERFRLTLMRIQLRYEKQYIRSLKPIFKQQKAEALDNLEAHASEYLSDVSKAAQQKLFDDAYYDQLMTTKLQPLLQDLVKTQGGLALVFAGDDKNEFHLTSNMIQYLQKNTLKMATNYNDETLDKLNATLAEGIEAGEGIGDLKKRVGEVYDDIDGYRTTRIARTETLKASNNATVDAYRQTGFVKNKVWVVNPDACPQCEEFDGKTVPLDDSFLPLGGSYTVTDEDGNETTYTNDYDTIEEPPLHPNCRCTIIPEA